VKTMKAVDLIRKDSGVVAPSTTWIVRFKILDGLTRADTENITPAIKQSMGNYLGSYDTVWGRRGTGYMKIWKRK
jgi:hypothetical protein